MNCTKNELYDAILIIADSICQAGRKGYEYLINSKTCLPKLTEMIIYDMFVSEKIDILIGTKEYKLILEYCKELHINGCVDFQ
jgi:hypothetical protein